MPTPDINTLITKVGFRYDDQQHLYIGDGHTTYVYNLYYDYFTISDRDLYMREKPDSISIVESAPIRRSMTADVEDSGFDRTVHRRD